MKKKLLIVGITMRAAGSERAFLSLARGMDFEKWDVTLLLAKKTGELLPLVPEQIKIKEMNGGELFLLDRSNARKILLQNYIKKNPIRAAGAAVSCAGIFLAGGKKKTYRKHRLWLKAMSALPCADGEYDLALAFWGDRTMFYVADKVFAKRKITWLHFDYFHPPRENALYEKYFLKFEKVVTVSEAIEKSLTDELPSLRGRVTTLENPVDTETIRKLSGEEADMRCDGIKLLTVGRICPQKGYDLALGAVARLINEDKSIFWYIIGEKSGKYAEDLENEIKRLGTEDNVIFLGTTVNPYKYMRACDVYFQPSRHEGKPLAVEEAKILAKPILATDYTSSSEQLDGGRLGMICEMNEDAIFDGLKNLIYDDDLKRTLSEALSATDFGADPRDGFESIVSEKK